MEFQIDQQQLLPIKTFLKTCRPQKGTKIPKDKLSPLSDLFREVTKVRINLNLSPLSPMETLTIALCLVNNRYNERADILGISTNTLRYYEVQAKMKLKAHSKTFALCKAIQMKIIELS